MHVPAKLVPFIASCMVASVVLGACGGSGSRANANSALQDEQQIVKFTRCMREHGVNISTPTTAGGAIRINGTNPQLMEAAQKACERYRPKDRRENLSPAERAARQDAVNKFAKCMREHGVELQTETRGSGGEVAIQLKGVNPESPSFQAAQKACQGLSPKLRPAGRTGGPRSGSGGPATESSGPASGSPGGGALSLGAGR
jgi:hypothetical protein